MQMRDIAAQLKSLDIDITDCFLVSLILNSLSSRFRRFKITYNTQKENWSINELLSMCVQEEGMLNSKKGEGSNEVHIVTNTNMQGHKGKNKKNELTARSEMNKDVIRCFFCKKKGHGFLNQRKPSPGEQLVFPRNQIGSHVEAIGTYRVVLNLFLWVFSLNINGFSFDLLKNGVSVGKFSLDNGLYKIHINSNVASSLVTVHGNSGIKRSIMNEKSSMLWHKRYTQSGQPRSPFAKFLQEQGIVPQYTMPGSPDMNGVAERRNNTLLDMVRSMVSNSKLPIFLWREALNTNVYIQNRIPTKAVSKTPFEIWKCWKPSLNHICVWGCPAEIRVLYNPHEKKLDPRTIFAYFVGYAERSKGYKFYCPTHNLKFVESRNAKFLENDTIS
ncbi:Retrovirus-related Pol polyprotein from transposon TNT 1-94 [Senna tora]|uniref:Retrovirus-related Pol polyprotein from transposon TNT 1-94 n=1 Tax=Senna tora TaxID=362788 RepID=A0A834XFS2_9FABA|nr:Retrovirus-related Pol polyprotein from transposon TNT 1-94 [Senna tora]